MLYSIFMWNELITVDSDWLFLLQLFHIWQCQINVSVNFGIASSIFLIYWQEIVITHQHTSYKYFPASKWKKNDVIPKFTDILIRHYHI